VKIWNTLRYLRRQVLYPALGIARIAPLNRLAPRFARKRRLSLVREAFAAGSIREALNQLHEISRYPDARSIGLFERLTEMQKVLDGKSAEVFFDGQAGTARANSPRIPPVESVLVALHSSFPHHRTGYAVRSHMILRHLQRLKLRVIVATRPGFPWDLTDHRNTPSNDGDQVDDVFYRRLTDGGRPRREVPDSVYVRHYAHLLAGLATENQAGVIHAASNYLNGLAAIRAAQSVGLPCVYEMRGLWHYSRAVGTEGFDQTDRYNYEDILEQYAAECADHVVVLSNSLRERLLSDWGLSEAKVTVVPNAVDTELFFPAERDESLRSQWGMCDWFVCGFIGSVTAYEGLDDLVKAISAISEKQKCGLIIVGDGRALADLERLAHELGCADRVRFVGRIPFSEVGRYYNCFDVCAYPRRDLPVCRIIPPLKPLEAMAMRIPIIVSRLSPLLELVEGGKSGVVTDPGSPSSIATAIRQLRDDPVLRANIAEAGYRYVRRERAWLVIAERYKQIYAALAEKRSSVTRLGNS